MSATTTSIAKVVVPEQSMAGELRAIKIVWEREVVRFASDRMRIGTALIQPLLFLFVLGTGLSRLTNSTFSLRTFMFPGILAMSVMFTAIFSAASIVWDREFGFLREMLVAPVRRSSLVIGKVLGGATVASLQGCLVLVLAGLVGVPYAPTLILGVFALQLLLAFSLTAFGVMIAARITQMQSFMAVTQMAIMPLFFISGAMFPTSGLPAWLTVLNRLDPMTYAVDPMRHLVFGHLDMPDAVRHSLNPGVTWGGWHVPPLVEALVVLVLGLVMLAIAIIEFDRTD